MFGKRLLASFALVMAVSFMATATARADAYNVDPIHSFVLFRVQHMSAGYVWGRFNGPTGSIAWDDSDFTKCFVKVQVQVANLDTGNKKRDGDLQGPNYFNAAQFPTIDFKSTAVKKGDGDSYQVDGDLTLHGVTKSITITLDKTGTGKGMRGETRQGWETTFSIKRSDYGMDQMLNIAGDEVRLTVSLEGIKQ